MAKYGLIGNGSWATAIAKIITDNGHQIHWWMRSEEAISFFQKKHHNENYLSSVKFNIEQFEFTSHINDVFSQCEDIIVCVPSAYLLEVIEQVPCELFSGKHIISAIKGLLPNYSILFNEYLEQHKGVNVSEQYACITGPCHAEEVAQEKLSYLTFSSLNKSLREKLAQDFKNSNLYTIENCDILGTQYASILKNVYAVGAGMVHGMGYGDNFMSVYITNCFREMMAFYEKRNLTAQSYLHENINSAYLGDLLVTCYSLHSRNRRFGHLLGQGYSIKNAILEMGLMAEGYPASKGIHSIVCQEGFNMPIVEAIYDILWENAAPNKRIKNIESLLV